MALDKGHPEAGFVEFEPLVLVGLDLVWVVVGILAIALLCGFWLILYLLNAILGKISVFGFHPFSFGLSLVNDAMKSAVGLLDDKTRAFGEFFWGIIQTLWRFFYVATLTIVGVFWTQDANNQLRQADQANETARAQFIEGQILNKEEQDVAALRATYDQAIAGLQQQIGQDVGDLNRDLAGQDAYTTQVHDELQAEITVLQNSVPTGLQAELNADIQNLTQQLAQQKTILEQEIANQGTSLQGQIAAGVNAAEGYATGLVSGLGIGNIVQTLTGLSGQVAKIATETAECLDPLCDTVTPNAQRAGRNLNWLKNLEALGVEALMLAIAAEAVADPAAVAHDFEDVLQPAGSALFTGFRDLVGI